MPRAAGPVLRGRDRHARIRDRTAAPWPSRTATPALAAAGDPAAFRRAIGTAAPRRTGRDRAFRAFSTAAAYHQPVRPARRHPDTSAEVPHKFLPITVAALPGTIGGEPRRGAAAHTVAIGESASPYRPVRNRAGRGRSPRRGRAACAARTRPYATDVLRGRPAGACRRAVPASAEPTAAR